MHKAKKTLRILGMLFLCAAVLFVFAVYRGVIVFDHSAERGFENSVTWKGHTYISCVAAYHEGKTIAKTTDGWEINEVKEDPSHTFIVLRSFLDQHLLVLEDYAIPTLGKVTAAFWNGEKIVDAAFCEAVTQIVLTAKTDFTYQTDAIFQLTDQQHMRTLFFCYEDCPIGTEFKGYMGKVDGRWVITTEIQSYDRSLSEPQTVACYTIPQEYYSVLEPYFS